MIIETDGRSATFVNLVGPNKDALFTSQSVLNGPQAALDSESAQKEEARNQLTIVTKKLSQAYAELDELRAVLDATNRSKQSLEQELSELQDRINDLNMQLGSLANVKRKIEGDYASLSRFVCCVRLRLSECQYKIVRV